MFGIGAGEFILIVIVGLIVFGVDRLPEYGRSLAKLLKEFRKAQNALTTALNEVDLDNSPNKSAPSSSDSSQVQKQVSSAEIPAPSKTTAEEVVKSSTESQSPEIRSVEQLTDLINENPVKVPKLNLSKELEK